MRGCTGVLAAVPLATARHGRFGLASATLATMGGLYFAMIKLRRRAKAHQCDGCPELLQLNGSGICSGFSEQAVSLRAFEEDASRLAMSR